VAITYVGGVATGRNGNSNSTTTQSLTSLTGGSNSQPSEGDLVIVCCAVGSQGRDSAQAISGYSTLGTQLNQSAVTYDSSMQVSYKVMTSTPDTSITIPAQGNAADGQAWAVMVFRGVDTSTPFDVSSVSAGGTGTGRPDPAAITPTTTGAWIVVAAAAAASATTTAFTFPADLSDDAVQATGADTNDARASMAYHDDWTSGSYNPAQYTGGTTGANDSWTAWTMALRPGAVAVALAGAATAGATASGALTLTVPIAGAASGGGAASAELAHTVTLTGAAVTASTANGAASVQVNLAGAALGGAGADGALSLTVTLEGAAILSALGDAALTVGGGVEVALEGDATAGATAAAEAAISKPLIGAADVSGQAAAALALGKLIEASATAGGQASAALAIEVHLAGSALAAVLGDADLSHGIPLAGGATLSGSADGEIVFAVPLAGDALATLVAGGSLAISIGLGGAAVASASAAAVLDGTEVPQLAEDLLPRPRAPRGRSIVIQPPRPTFAWLKVDEAPDRVQFQARTVDAADWNFATGRAQQRISGRAPILESAGGDVVSLALVRAAMGGRIAHQESTADALRLTATSSDDELIAAHLPGVFELFRMAG
jgi:hypothetical protein